MSTVRAAVAMALVVVAMALQVSVFSEIAWNGIVPDLVLLVVVAGALVRGGRFGILLGFTAGVLLDLTPPADHTAGRWALALLIVGYVAGRLRPEGAADRNPPALTVVAVVAGCSFLGTSVFTLTGLLTGDIAAGVGQVLPVIGISLVWDVLLTPLLVPGMLALFRRLEPDRVSA